MLQKIMALMGLGTKSHREINSEEMTTHLNVHPAEEKPSASQYDDATRPTYRIGKHKPSDIHKALDLAG